MITSYKHHPVIGSRKFITTTLIDILIGAWSFKTKATIPCDDNKRICHFVLHAALINKLGEVSMNISTHHNAFSFREIQTNCIHIAKVLKLIHSTKNLCKKTKTFSGFQPTLVVRFGTKMPGENASISIYFENERLNYMRYGR